jgi:putative CocE/NonD family hydrolase
MRNTLPALVLVLLCNPSAAGAKKVSARAKYIRANYTKFEFRIPMRDGAKLFTAVYLPNDRTKRHPILLERTPYRVAPYGADRYPRELGPTEAFEKAGYIFVRQDVRGRFMSEGRFVHMRPHRPRGISESSDTYDTIAWLLKHLRGRHNGRVGMHGISYPGFYAIAGAINGHPALKAVSPQAPIADWFWDDVHHHGALVLPLAFNFFRAMDVQRKGLTTRWAEPEPLGTPDGYQFFLDLGPLGNVNRRFLKGKIPFWNAIVAHPNYDAFWQSRNILPHLKNIRAAVLTVGGWYDAEDLYGSLQVYKTVERQNPRANNRLVMGPWTHGGWRWDRKSKLGAAEFGYVTGPQFHDSFLLPFFEHHLKGRKLKMALPEALTFETGANRWRTFTRWPPRRARQRVLYLRKHGKLSFSPPNSSRSAHDAFISDPRKPVPYTMKISTRRAKRYMAEDQRFAAWRPDVLVYRTQPLKADFTVAGPLRAVLYVSTSQSAADWVVKLIDVQPGRLEGEKKDHVSPRGGQQVLVRGEMFRGRFRDSYSAPKPFTPWKVAKVAFELPDVLHTFKRGHRIMIHVQSSWFPFFDRNPQRYVPNIYEAKRGDFVTATHRVYRSAKHPSRVEI